MLARANTPHKRKRKGKLVTYKDSESDQEEDSDYEENFGSDNDDYSDDDYSDSQPDEGTHGKKGKKGSVHVC